MSKCHVFEACGSDSGCGGGGGGGGSCGGGGGNSGMKDLSSDTTLERNEGNFSEVVL